MTLMINRRRFLAISAAMTVASPAMATPVARWQGTALGAGASLQIVGMTQSAADPVFVAIRKELDRLEGIFSLYIGHSELAVLNRDGRLAAPSLDMLSVLSLANSLHAATEGAFDPTVQPLWSAHAQATQAGRALSGQELAQLRQRIGWQHVEFDAQAVRFSRPDMAITLNGIAQGYITDQIAATLRGQGLTDVMVDMGEISALGGRSDGGPWRAGIADVQGHIVQKVALRDRALATSSPLGTLLDASSDLGHILDPRSDDAPKQSLVSVSASDAVLADGLSTALCLMDTDQFSTVLEKFPSAKLEWVVLS